MLVITFLLEVCDLVHDSTQLVINNSNFQLKQNLFSVVFSLHKPNNKIPKGPRTVLPLVSTHLLP
jgi:hypothetical protein